MSSTGKRKYLLILSLLCLTIYLTGAGKLKTPVQPPAFSETKSFYPGNIQVALDIPGTSEIYYTLDGSTPSRESLLYQNPLRLQSPQDGFQIFTLRAIGYDNSGECTNVYTHTYFLGETVNNRFSTLIISITSDPANLYDDERGILVGGRMKREYLEAHPEVEDAAAPANYYFRGIESERESYVEILNPDGTLLVSQPAGIRVHGGVSRSLEQKSLRLIAREEYGQSLFELPLFEGQEQSAYKKFVLRNSGNDNLHAFMRNECALLLAKEAGFPDTTQFRPAAVFVNGTYYGFEWVTELYDNLYFHSHYNTSDGQGSWQVLDVKNRSLEANNPKDLTEIQAVQNWNEIYLLCTQQDLTDDYVFQNLKDRVDIENLLLYHAIEIYLANPDWPFNNNKVYRWYSNSNDYEDSGSTDGKWRFLTYDFDEAIAKCDSSAASDLSLSKALGLEDPGSWNRYNPMLASLLRREDMKTRFTEIMEELMEGAFSPENFCAAIDQVSEMRKEEAIAYLRFLAMQEESTEEAREQRFQSYYEELLESEQIMRDFARERPSCIREELKVLDSF